MQPDSQPTLDRRSVERSSGVTEQYSLRAIAPFGVGAFLWASEFAAIRAGLDAYAPEHVALLRYMLTAAVLAGYALLTGMRLPARRDIPGIALTGFLGFSVFTTSLSTGEVGVTAGTASFLITSAPIFMLVFAALFLGEWLSPWGWFGTLVSFAGIGLITLVGSEGGLTLNRSALMVVVAAIAESLYFILQKPYLRKYSAVEFTTYAVWMGTPFLLVFTPGLVQTVRAASGQTTLAIIYMGVVVSTLAPISWAVGLSRTRASISAGFLYLIPVFATLIGWVWLREVPPASSLAGGLLVVAGLAIVHRQMRYRHPRA